MSLVERGRLAGVVRAAFGPRPRLSEVVRLRGGSKKGVYRLVFDAGSSAILYVWGAEENYWPPSPSDANGLDPFEAAHAYLGSVGVRVPRAYLIDRSASLISADFAVVEDVRGGTLEALLERDPEAARPTLAALAHTLELMHGHRGDRPGPLGSPVSGSCEAIVLDRALGDLDEAGRRVERLGRALPRLEKALHELASAVRPRTEYSLIHGELGPDHVLVDDEGWPVLIDIEGTMFFDVEWEHAFLRLRFGSDYPRLRRADLDEARLRFYTLAMHLSLVAGPLRLLDGDFPERGPMLEIAEHNTDRALSFVSGRAPGAAGGG